MSKFIHYLTISRMLAGPFIFILVIFTHYYGLALIVFLAASITDYLDGFFARKYNHESELGAILDPIADKILTLFLIITLGLHLESAYFSFIGAIILAREFWVSALRDLNSRTGNTHATKVSILAKLKTTLQLSSFSGFLLGIYLNNMLILFLSNFILFSALLLTLYTGLLYTIETFAKSKSF